jgi:hypothetical protein
MYIQLHIETSVAAYEGIAGRSPKGLTIRLNASFHDQINDLVI